MYLENEGSLAKQKPGYTDDVTTTESFRLLKEDPNSRVVLYCKLTLQSLVEKFSPLTADSSWGKLAH
jgi:hypothetical protein